MVDNHYSPEDWADFARHAASPEAEADMRRHLDRGCLACTELHATFREVYAIGAVDGAYEPPAAAVRLARAMFAVRTPERPFARMASAVTLLFDSALMPASIGLRSVPNGPRKFLFAAGDMVIDLQVSPASKGSTVVVGQVTVASAGDRRVAGMPALLHRGLQRVARATTNDDGEFEMEFEGPAQDLSLALGSDPNPTVITLGTFTRTQS
jgi:hypothetical protein